MSKLAEQINYAIQNKRAVDNSFDFKYNVSESLLPNHLQLVAFEATFGSRYYIDEALTYKDSEVLAETLKQVKRSVIEEVFGEFRKPLNELRHYLYNRDVPAALETLSNLERQIFNV